MPETEQSNLICVKQILTDSHGNELIELVPRAGDVPEGFKHFCITRAIGWVDKMGQPQRLNGVFFIDADDPEEAFRQLPATESLAKRKLEERMKREQKKLVVAREAPNMNGHAPVLRFDPNP